METLNGALTQEQLDAIIESVQAARRFAQLMANDTRGHLDITPKGWVALTPMGEIILAARDYVIRLAQILERNDQACVSVRSLLH